MRTTLTIEADVYRRLREAARSGKTSFKKLVNDALRIGLGLERPRRTPFRVVPFRGGLRTGIDPDKLNQLNDELEANRR